MSVQDVVLVIAAAIINMVIGALWYSPLLFANRWLYLINKKPEDIEGAGSAYAITFVASLVMAAVLAIFINAVEANTLLDGAAVGALAFLGFIATGTLAYTTFEGPPLGVWALYNGYQLISLVVMGAILTL